MVLSPRIPSRYVSSLGRDIFYLFSPPKTKKFGKNSFLDWITGFTEMF